MKSIIITCLCTSLLLAQNIKEVTLEKAISIALENNKQNKVTKLALQIADVQYKQALSANYPTINAILVGQRKNEDLNFEMKGDISLPSDTAKALTMATLLSNGLTLANAQTQLGLIPSSTFENTTLSLDTSVKAKGRDTVRGSVNLQYPVYTGGKISAIIEQAKLNKHIALKSIKREEDTVIYDVKRYFYGYVLTNELYKIAKETHNRMKFVANLTKRFYESGESLNVKKTDYLSVQVTESLIESMTAKLEANKIMIKSALMNTLGMSWSEDINIKYKKEKLLPINYSLETLVKEAYNTNSDISKMDIALKIKDEQIKEKKAEHLPTLAFLGEVSHTYNSYEYGFLNENQEDQWSVGFAASLPLFNGFKTTNSVTQKVIEKRKMYLLRDMLKEGVALQIKNELTKALIGYKQIKTLEKAKKLAKDNRKLNIRGYQIDAIKPDDVIQAQYIEAYVKADHLKYIHDYLISLAKIDLLIGRELK